MKTENKQYQLQQTVKCDKSWTNFEYSRGYRDKPACQDEPEFIITPADILYDAELESCGVKLNAYTICPKCGSKIDVCVGWFTQEETI